METGSRWRDIVGRRYGPYTLAINLGIFMWAINNLVVAGIMPTVVADIGGMRLYSWTFALFSTGSVIGAASAGPLRETFGARAAYAWAGILFGIGLAGAAASPNMEILVAMRLIQGLGGGAVSSLGYAMMATLYPERLRGRILAFTSMAWGIATSFGPGFGGIFAEYGLWRGAFWGMTPLVLIFVVVALRYIPATQASKRLNGIPYWRLATIGGAVLALSASSQADLLWLRVALVVASLVLAVLMFRRDGRAKRPMFPRQALRIRTPLGAVYWVMALNSATVVTYSTFQTLQLQALHGVPPIVAAYLFMLSSLCWSLTALVVATWHGRMETVGIFTGLTTLIVGAGGLALTVVPGPVLAIAVFIATAGAGIGQMNNLLIQRAIRYAPADEKSTAGASVQAIRTMGVAFGAAGAGLVAVAAGLVSNDAPRATVAYAMHWVYGFDVAIALASFGCALAMVAADRRAKRAAH